MFDMLKYNLKHNRKSVVKTTTAWLIFGAIILVFVFWGMTPRNQAVGSGGAAATVNDTNISLLQFNEMKDRMRHDPRMEQLQSLGADAGRQILDQQALSQLVEIELIRQATERERLWTSDAEVREFILGMPQFNQDGHFSAVAYKATLENMRKTPGDFEDEIRNSMAIRRTERLFSSALKPVKLEVERVKAISSQKANLEFVSIPAENVVVPEAIALADEKAFLAQPGADAKVKEYFESHKQEFSSPERVKVRHILIRAKAGDADAEKKALAKIEDLEKRAKKEDFGKLATEFSEDPGSKTKGGVIDYFSRGRMVPQFEEAAFSLKANEISAPVKTDYGYHLVQVLDKKPASSRTLDEVKDEIAGILIAKDRSHAEIDALQAALKKGDNEAVQKFMTEHKLKWDETGAFAIDSQQVPKVGPNEDMLRAAFQLTPEKPLAPALFHEGGRAFVVRYKAVPAAKDEKKEPNSDLMAQMAASRRGEEALGKWVEGLRKTAHITTNPQVFKGERSED